MQKIAKNTGKVIKATRNEYLVNIDNNIVNCKIRGKIPGTSNGAEKSVKVGDDVIVHLFSEKEGVIEEILPRKSKLSRSVAGKAYQEHIIAANIDQMLIILSTKRPAFKSGLLDRYLVIAEKNELQAIICINKIDLSEVEKFKNHSNYYPEIGYPVFLTSARTGTAIENLKSELKNKVSVLVGPSGAGKSSVLQKMEAGLDLKVAEVSGKTNKGKHATTHVQLFQLSFGGFVIDTPGIRELGLWDIYQDELKEYFVDFVKYQDTCRFSDCQHLQEPDCAVKKAVDEGEVFKERYRNYKNIHADLRTAPYELIRKR